METPFDFAARLLGCYETPEHECRTHASAWPCYIPTEYGRAVALRDAEILRQMADGLDAQAGRLAGLSTIDISGLRAWLRTRNKTFDHLTAHIVRAAFAAQAAVLRDRAAELAKEN